MIPLMAALRSTSFSSSSLPSMIRFAVADDPNIGADAGVIEHISRQLDDRFD
jgi:hypothetical protein